VPDRPTPAGRAQQTAAEARSGQDDDEQASERTENVREGARAGGNAGMSRIRERDASAGRRVGARLRVTQTKSTISHIGRNRATVRALGLRRIGDTVVVADNDATRGMVRRVRFLVSVEELPEGEKPGSTGRARQVASGERSEVRGNAPASQRPEDQGGDEHGSERAVSVRERRAQEPTPE
jgi:large subunit ribosomal protein L30